MGASAASASTSTAAAAAGVAVAVAATAPPPPRSPPASPPPAPPPPESALSVLSLSSLSSITITSFFATSFKANDNLDCIFPLPFTFRFDCCTACAAATAATALAASAASATSFCLKYSRSLSSLYDALRAFVLDARSTVGDAIKASPSGPPATFALLFARRSSPRDANRNTKSTYAARCIPSKEQSFTTLCFLGK